MKATMTYELACERSHLSEKAETWTLYEKVTPELGPSVARPIAIFNLESECMRFMAHLYVSKVPGIELPDVVKRLFTAESKQ